MTQLPPFLKEKLFFCAAYKKELSCQLFIIIDHIHILSRDPEPETLRPCFRITLLRAPENVRIELLERS